MLVGTTFGVGTQASEEGLWFAEAWPLLIDFGTYKTVKAKFWPWLAD